MNRRRLVLGIAAACLLVVPGVLVAVASVPHTFSNGQFADATQVNANFTALENAVNGLGLTVTRVSAQITIAASDSGAVQASCPAGTVLTGGGCEWDVCCANKLNESHPVTGFERWRCEGSNTYPAAYPLRAYALCAKVE